MIEMLVTLAVFILLTACVFGIVSSVLQSAASLRDNQQRRDQSAALDLFVRTKLRQMTGSSVFFSYRNDDGGGPHSGIIFDFVGHAEAFDAVAQPDGLYTLRYVDLPTGALTTAISPAVMLGNEVANNDPPVAWQSLVRDIRSIDWKFQDANGSPWVAEWNNNGTRPALVQMSLQLAGEVRPSVSVFWIPPLVNIVPTTVAPAGG